MDFMCLLEEEEEEKEIERKNTQKPIEFVKG